jgi:hypothetical protein
MLVHGNRPHASSQLQVTICSRLHPKKSTVIIGVPIASRLGAVKLRRILCQRLADLGPSFRSEQIAFNFLLQRSPSDH